MTDSRNIEIPISREDSDSLEWVIISPFDIGSVRQAEDFGEYARERREFLGMSQNFVAMTMKDVFDIPWHQTVVAKIESGQRQVKLAEALALSLIYGMSLENLMTGWDLEDNNRLETKDPHGQVVAKPRMKFRITPVKDDDGLDSEKT